MEENKTPEDLVKKAQQEMERIGQAISDHVTSLTENLVIVKKDMDWIVSDYKKMEDSLSKKEKSQYKKMLQIKLDYLKGMDELIENFGQKMQSLVYGNIHLSCDYDGLTTASKEAVSYLEKAISDLY